MFKTALLGALALAALFAVPVGTMMFVGPSTETAGVASGSALDCGSPRDAWKPACQPAKTASARDADVTGSIGDETAGTARRRSVADVAAQPNADASASSAPASAGPQAAPPQQVAQASPEPVRPEPNQAGGREAQPWRDPVRTEPAQAPEASAPRPPAADQSGVARAEKATAPRAEPVQAAVPSTDRTRTGDNMKPVGLSPKKPVPASDTAPAEAEAAPAPSRRELRRAARADSVRAAQARPKPQAVAEQAEDDEPARAVRRRARPVRKPVAEARRSSRVANVRPWPRRVASRRGPPDRTYATTGDLRVFSVQTYVLPDGRRMVVNVRPRPNVVRELAAQHAAAFSTRRAAAMPHMGGSGWGGWFGADDN